MIYLTIASAVFAAFACFAEGQSTCKTPNGVSGACKSLYECKQMLDIVKKNNISTTEVEFLRKSHCGFQGNTPTVCCPPDNGAAVNDCSTPDGDSGKCVDIHQCKHISEMLKPPVSQEIITFIKNSKCPGKTEYSVCCGPTPVSKTSTQSPDSCASTVSAYPPDPATECCGVDADDHGNKIIGVGGTWTAIVQYPWAALIEYHKNDIKKHLCGGVLISGRYVLTAAHCVVGGVLRYGTPRIVRLGEYDIANDGPDCIAVETGGTECTDDVLLMPIESITPHPEYVPDTVERRNDIALIRLGNLAPFTDFIRPICLPRTDVTLDPPSYFTMYMAGWGANETHFSTVKKTHVDLPYVKAEQCQEAYDAPGRTVKLWNKQTCAGGVKGKDSCKGDSGGPLMYENGKNYEAIGVVSFGPIVCGTEDVPGVYTKVFEYKDWILNNIKP